MALSDHTRSSPLVPRARFDGWLLFACALGLALRLIQFDAPLADSHRWRQIENAAVAWSFHSGTFNPFYPEANWGGAKQAWVQMEFPALPALMAVGYSLFGVDDRVGRVIVIGASLALIVSVYLAGRRLVGVPAARGAAVLAAVSPSAVFFGRVPMADVPMVALTTLGLAGVLAYLDEGRRRPLILGTACLALGFLMKITGVLILAPIVWAAWERKRWTAWREWPLAVALLAAVAITAAWHVHAELIYRDTGLTVGIWRPFGNLPPDVAAITGTPSAYSLWSSGAVLGNAEFYQTIFWRFWSLHLTPIGFALALAGGLLGLGLAGGRTCLMWLLGGFAYVLAIGGGNQAHEVLPAAGVAAAVPARGPCGVTALRHRLGAPTRVSLSGRARGCRRGGARVRLDRIPHERGLYGTSSARSLWTSPRSRPAWRSRT